MFNYRFLPEAADQSCIPLLYTFASDRLSCMYCH